MIRLRTQPTEITIGIEHGEFGWVAIVWLNRRPDGRWNVIEGYADTPWWAIASALHEWDAEGRPCS